MKRRRLVEGLEMHVIASSLNADILFKNMVSQWSGRSLAEVSTLLGFLMFANQLHHTHHWVCKGSPSYGDHLLFQRLYEGIQDEIDGLGEKVVGLGSVDNVDMPLLVQQVGKWTSLLAQPTSTIQSPGELARKSLEVEMLFLKFADMTAMMLKEAGILTRGLDNLLAGLQDSHESHVFLLKQRIQESL
jgi:DNA-binding ferritin-like protein